MKIRVLVVDDSALVRQIIMDVLGAEPDIEVVGYARDGLEAFEKTIELKPDVVTMDLEMPKLNGLEALRRIMKARPTPVIMVSSHTASGAKATMDALECGALDFICKPASLALLQAMRKELVDKVRHAKDARIGHKMLKSASSYCRKEMTDRVVVVASSTGGPRALACLFETLPKDFPLPMLIVQHMPQGFTGSFARRLDSIGTLPCYEAKPGDVVEPGRALLAPGGIHMLVKPKGKIVFDDSASIHGVKPAADYLFTTAAKVYGERCIAVVLTGMGRDGMDGAIAIKKSGGSVITESEKTCTIFGMPRAVIQAGVSDESQPIGEIASAITRLSGGRLARAS